MRIMQAVVPALAVALAALSAAAQDQNNVTLPRFPSISPDGTQVVFSWRGDLWKVSSDGGQAERLSAHPFNDTASAWSRDGRLIAFVSDRSGSANLFVMNADGTGVRQVTEIDRNLALTGFGVDDQGKPAVMFSGSLEPEPGGAPRPLMIAPGGGEVRRAIGAYGSFALTSPDGSKVLFNRGFSSWSRRNYRGADNRDIWLFDRRTNAFSRLTSWEGNDGRARWLDDRAFVYASDRQDRCVNLYRLSLGEDESKAVRLTDFKETDVEDFDVSADGRKLVFAMWDSLYTLDLASRGARPVRLAIRAEEDEQDNYVLKDISRTVSESALSPDGKTMAVIAYGEVYVRSTEPRSPARRVTATAAREKQVAWSPDGASLYFTSDETGREAIYAARVRLTRGEVKRQVEEMRREAAPGTRPVGNAATTQGASGATTRPATQPSEASRWPDAIAFSIEAVVLSEKDNLSQPSPSPDGKALAFRRGLGELMVKELSGGRVRQMVPGWSSGLGWRWSPDGRYIAYNTEDENYNSDVWVVRPDGSGPAVNVSRHPATDHSPRWSADGKVLALLSERVNREMDVWAVYLDKDLETLTPQEVDGYYKSAGAAAKKREPLKPATRPATTRPATSPAAATDPAAGDVVSEERQLVALHVDDIPSVPSQPATQPATQPVVVTGVTPRKGKPLDLDDAYLRLRRITTLSGNEGELEITPGGERFIFSATVGGERGTYTAAHDGSGLRKIGAAVNVQHLSLSGEQAAFVDGGRAGLMKLPDGAVEFMDVADQIRLDLAAQAKQKFMEASRILGAVWWDPKLNGLDWPLVTARYLKLVEGARTADEFDHVAAKLLGELNGSHLGINTPEPTSPNARSVGRLGITRTRAEKGYRVESVLADGPAGKGPMRLEAGDVITAIDLDDIGPADTLEQKLAGKVGKECIVTVKRAGRDDELHLLITPMSYNAWADLFYKQWRLETAKKVSDWSAGRIGYIHIQGMNQPSLDIFERDLYAAAQGKAGLIIDVRNNGGGWTTDRLLASICAPDHAYTVARGMPQGMKGYPNDRLFIARYTLPINMVCNERSFSNAEIISHAFKTLKRGTLVGQRTYGGVISTGSASLIDGTTVRIPFRGWFLPDGTPQENNGAIPDLLVEQRPEDEVKGNDAQLRAAVEDLMKRL